MNKDVNDDETAAGRTVENVILDLLDQDIAAVSVQTPPYLMGRLAC